MAENVSSLSTPLARAERFVWLTARVLEQRLFEYHFLGGGADPVETALAAYRNDDDGFGHALEPDLRGPVSQPLHTAHALKVLDLIGRCDGRQVERICRYLTKISTPEGALPALHPSLRGYPAAPWIPVVDNPPSALLATGPVVGVLHRNEVWHAWLFRATDYCWAAVESMEETHPYEVEAAVAFLDGAPDRPRAAAAAQRLGRLVRDRRLVLLDPEQAADVPVAPGYAPGNTTWRTTSHPLPARWPATGSPTRKWSGHWTTSSRSRRRTAAGRSTGGSGHPALPWRAARS